MPTLAAYLVWIRAFMGVPATVLPDNSIYIASSYATALEIVADELSQVSTTLYADAVYNLAGHILITTAQDVVGASFTGYITGNNLTVVTLSSGTIASGQTITATGLNALIIGGANLAWTVNPAQTYGSVSTPLAMTSTNAYFSNLRAMWKIFEFVGGVVSSSSDEGSSTSLATPEVMQRLKFSDLQYIKTPYGQAYLAYDDRLGSPFGMS